MAKIPTPQDTEINIIGAGAMSHPWYVSMAANYTADYTADPSVPNNWSIRCTMFDGDHEDARHTKLVTIDHAALLAAITKIAAGAPAGVNGDCQSECGTFLHNPDEADFDSGMADDVLQVLAYGEVVYS